MGMKFESLDDLIALLLEGDIISNLKKWYLEAVKSKYQYVVFVVRRSYVLSTILEEITEVSMEDTCFKKFLTDASVVLHCEEMAEHYQKKGTFPKILLCDDLLLHGRNINNVLTAMQVRLAELLPNEKTTDINNALVDAVRIHVFAKLDDRLLLLPSYSSNIDYKYNGNLAFIHQISSDISLLISNANVANATYVFSEKITDKEFGKIDKSNLVFTKYQNIEQYTSVDFLGLEEVRAIFTVRIIKKYDGYRVIPYVFLPNLDSEETKNIANIIYDRLIQKGMISQQNIDYIFGDFMDVNHKRSFNEFLSFVFAHALLEDFNNEYNIIRERKDEVCEIEKLARNYNFTDYVTSRNVIQSLVQFPILKSKGELIRIIKDTLSEKRCLFAINEKAMNETEKNILERIENFFYIQGVTDELAAFQMLRKNYPIFEDRSVPSLKNCDTVLSVLCSIYNMQDVKISVSYFLQFMDAGILSLSSVPSREIKVLGYSQFAKAGEQSLIIYPLRMDKYMFFLDYMQEMCEMYNKTFIEQLKKFSESEFCRFDSEEIDEMRNFVEFLNSIGQTPCDWKDNYLIRLNIYSQSFKEVINYYKVKVSYREDYKQYLRKYEVV